MRLLTLLLAIASSTAWAQEPAPVGGTYAPLVLSTPGAPPPPQARLLISPDLSRRWHNARVLYNVGGVTGLLGVGLTVSSIVVIAATGYPCNPLDPQHSTNPNDTCNPNGVIYHPSQPTDAAPMLAYLGSSVSALGFILSAAGLGYQHRLLTEVHADPGRGVFTGGTVLGVLGFTATGASYFFGFTNYLNPHDQGVAILASSLTGAGLCALGGLLYLIDASRTKRAWARLTTF